jgi:hypothetical protein
VVASNAWERAQDAIAHASQRATERDEDVITPDNAESPFDASATTVIPGGLAARRGVPVDPELTQRLPQNNGGRRTNGHHRRPDEDDRGAHDDSDARTVRFGTGPTHPGTSPFPASPFTSGPFPAGDDGAQAESPQEKPRRPWWRRLFGG